MDAKFLPAGRPTTTCLLLLAALLSSAGLLYAPLRSQDEPQFLRGDANADGKVSISDALTIRRRLFIDGGEIACRDAADCDDSGLVNITDVVYILNSLFMQDLGADPPRPPYPAAGADPTADGLTCAAYSVIEAEETADTVRLGEVEGAPGDEVEIPVFLTNSMEVEAFQVLVRYDATVFSPNTGRTAVSFDGTYYEPLSAPRPYESFPGYHALDPGIEPGVLSLGLVPSLVDEGFEVPPGEDRLVFKIRGRVSESAAPGTLVLLEPTNGEGDQGFGHAGIRNELTYEGEARFISAIPRTVPGRLQIVGDQIIFRGDTDDDSTVNLSDAVLVLNYLFLEGAAPNCPDAADADDDGKLNITDALAILNTLYLSSHSIAPPYPERGVDPTPDPLGPCLK